MPPPVPSYCNGCQDCIHAIIPCESKLLNLNNDCSRGVCIGYPESGACIELDILHDTKPKEHKKEMRRLRRKFFLVCPACWDSAASSKEKKKARPYDALYSRKYSTPLVPSPIYNVHQRTIGFYNQLNLDKIGVVDISHPDFAKYPIAYKAIKNAISTWHLDSGPYFKSKVVLGVDSYTSFCEDVKSNIVEGNITELVVLVTTHSTDQGRLEWGRKRSLDAEQFFDKLFTTDMRTHLKNVKAHLILMCCPGMFQIEFQYNAFVALAKEKIFKSIVGFPNQHDLKAFKAGRFAGPWFERIIRLRESYDRALHGICQSLPELGHHTSILVGYQLQDSTIRVLKGVWCQQYRAPFGIQWQEAICRQCRSFNALEFKRVERTIVISCRHANHQGCRPKEIEIDGLYLNAPQGPKQSSGEWHFEKYAWNRVDSQSFEALIESIAWVQ